MNSRSILGRRRRIGLGSNDSTSRARRSIAGIAAHTSPNSASLPGPPTRHTRIGAPSAVARARDPASLRHLTEDLRDDR